MIARTHRFHGFNALKAVYQRGQTARSALFTTKYVVNPRRQTYRAAVVVSRKVHKSAVVRNRIRRRIYEVIRRHAAEFTGPYDVVVTVFSEQVATLNAAELEHTLVGQLQKARVLRGSGGGPQRGRRDIVER